MSIDKSFQKIKVQITELSETMQHFMHESIQPSTADCDKLRQQMNDVLELLAVYKFHKNDTEIEPSFKLHAMVSEKAVVLEETKEIIEIETRAPGPAKNDSTNSAPESILLQPLSIGINDKFRFINELFSQNSSEYNIVFEQLSNLKNWHDTELYLNSLKGVYGWKDNNEVVKYFYSIARKRFD